MMNFSRSSCSKAARTTSAAMARGTTTTPSPSPTIRSPGQDGDAAAADRHVDVLRVVDPGGDVRALPLGVGRQVERADRRRIPKRAVGDDAGRAALHDARRQDVAQRCGARITPRVDDQHVAWPDGLHRQALLAGGVVGLTGWLEVLARRDVAQRKRGPARRSSGRSGRTPCMNVLAKPRFCSWLVSVAVLMRLARSRVSGATTIGSGRHATMLDRAPLRSQNTRRISSSTPRMPA